MVLFTKDNFQLNNRTAEKFTQKDDKAEKERDEYKKSRKYFQNSQKKAKFANIFEPNHYKYENKRITTGQSSLSAQIAPSIEGSS